MKLFARLWKNGKIIVQLSCKLYHYLFARQKASFIIVDDFVFHLHFASSVNFFFFLFGKLNYSNFINKYSKYIYIYG